VKAKVFRRNSAKRSPWTAKKSLEKKEKGKGLFACIWAKSTLGTGEGFPRSKNREKRETGIFKGPFLARRTIV